MKPNHRKHNLNGAVTMSFFPSTSISQNLPIAQKPRSSFSLVLQTLKMSRLNRLIRNVYPNQGLRSFVAGSPVLRRFSTESQPPTGTADSNNQSASTIPFFETPSPDLVYGRLYDITKFTSKTDILSLFGDCNLSRDDIKVTYNREYMATSMLIQFSTLGAFDTAYKALLKKGRIYRLERADRANWEYVQPYDGKFVLLQGIPRNATPDDVDRFMYGCNHDNIRMFLVRLDNQDPIRMALVRFPSPTAAMSAVINKNRGFCLNNQISAQVLE